MFRNANAPNSPNTFIKNEPMDSPMTGRGFNMFPDNFHSMSGNEHNHHNEADFNMFGGDRDNINPANLTMDQQGFGRNVPPSNGFHAHGMGYGMEINDNDLLDTIEGHVDGVMVRDPSNFSDFSPMLGPSQQFNFGSAPDSFNQNSPMLNVYGQKSFPHRASFNGDMIHTPSSLASPVIQPSDESAPSFDSLPKRKIDRPSGVVRTNSRKDGPIRSPITSRAPGLSGLSISTKAIPQPINGGFPWSANMASSYGLESTLSSPGLGTSPHHPLSIDMLASAKHASLPSKMDPISSAQDAKRRRRRESHNLVERRRRDNINERIQELSHLVPPHRLDDEKVRKHLANNSALPASLAGSSMSPPKSATLPPGVARRAGAVPGTSLPGEEKDKGPNKGDILNGAVSWTKDLMWALYKKLKEEQKLREYISSIGGTWPFEETEEEKRMASELIASVEKYGAERFNYSRAPGSSLHVPGFTLINGEPIGTEGSGNTPDTSASSPVPGRVGTSSLSRTGSNQPWNSDDQMVFKEEEEFEMGGMEI